MPQNLLRHITRRQRELLELAAEGLSDVEASARLGISVETVRHYWRELRSDFGKKNRAFIIAQYALAQSRATANELVAGPVSLMLGSHDPEVGLVLCSFVNTLATPLVLVNAETGSVPFANTAMEDLIGGPAPLSRSRHEYKEWQGYGTDGKVLSPDQWPASVTLDLGKPVETDLFLRRRDESWVLTHTKTIPVLREDRVAAVVVLAQALEKFPSAPRCIRAGLRGNM
jgi:DNA-binding CsgD family transcriptional regulator